MNLCSRKFTEIKPNRQLDKQLVPETLNQHEITNRYRRLAAEVGRAACVEQQSIAEWLEAHDRAEVFNALV